ncbi:MULTISPECIES: ArsC/Spx/MgsR family protein [Pseudoalteromonas]|uniref:ArsC/Spx/MgsR family protein n=1 Tax=Pseudoalteromonas TaxID=53246 RepID=UPI000BB460AE|nr:hypothetical protein [Pseudoalteromonas sp. SWYJZ12]
MAVKATLRVTKFPARELALLKEDITEDTILETMLEYLILVDRPIFCTVKGIGLCCPSKTGLNSLEREAVDEFSKQMAKQYCQSTIKQKY